jgi:hypothetical protein
MTGKKKGKTTNPVKKRPSDPTKDAPFRVDPDSEDFVTPRNDLSEDELKEQEDRRS